jgi:aryl-alcohol dehydrogenase-like predicted oxidoreductase
MKLCAKLALGTAQWGLAYGVTNAVGRPAVGTVSRMIDAAARAGVGMLDTARAYGDAERIIGDSTAARDFEVVTKTDPNALVDPTDAARGISASLAALRRDRVHAILVHHGDRMLVDGDAQWTALQRARHQGLATRIGVSVYNPDALRRMLQRFEIQIVQIPASLYDRRFERCGLLDELARRDIEVHVRSVFLQGLILAPPECLPATFVGLSEHQKRCHAHLAACGLTPLEGALCHALSDERISRVVVGAECDTQLGQIFAAATRCNTALGPVGTFDFALEDERVILPYNWPADLRIVPPAPGKQGELA